MKVLLINGSPHATGSTYTALHEMEKVFVQEGMETELVQVGNQDVRGCIACGACGTKGKCVFDDVVNELAVKFEQCDGLVVGSPVYYASANATLIAVLDRLFHSSHFDKTMKVGTPYVEGATVTAKCEKQGRGKKITGTGKSFEFAYYGGFETNFPIIIPNNTKI